MSAAMAMSFEEFRKLVEAEQAKSVAEFAACFNAEMKKRGSASTFEDVLGGKPVDETARKALVPTVFMPAWDAEKIEQLADFFLEIYNETSDDDPRVVVLRAMAVYRSFVKHARAGGQVKFVKDGQPDRTLKVRLR